MSSLIKPLWYFGVNFFLLKKMYECEHATAVTLKCDSCFTANTLQLTSQKILMKLSTCSSTNFCTSLICPFLTFHIKLVILRTEFPFFEKLCVCKGVSVYKMKPEVIYPKTFAVFITNYFIGYNSAPFSQWNNLLQTTLEFCYVVHWIVVYWSVGAIYFIVQHITKDINCSVPAADEIEYCR